MQEVIDEERALWIKERNVLRAQISELEARLRNPTSNDYFSASTGSSRSHILSPRGVNSSKEISPSMRVTSPSSNIPQESGRDADGRPFYAPAPRNPARTFSVSETKELRLDDISGSGENAIVVPSKVFTPSHFGVQSPEEPHSVPETPTDSIDISLIQPDLEGVPIRASAVAPDFVARVLSPQHALSPLKSPTIHPHGHQERSLSAPQPKLPTLEVIKQPENRRLTMHAGHTPNHSISKLDLLAESGSATPTQNLITQHDPPHGDPEEEKQEEKKENQEDQEKQQHHHEAPEAPAAPGPSEVTNPDATAHDHWDENEDGDVPLKGQLGLTNNGAKDEVFLAELVKKLAEEARRSEEASPDESVTSPLEDDDGKDDDMPILKLKPTFNFGRPMGEV